MAFKRPTESESTKQQLSIYNLVRAAAYHQWTYELLKTPFNYVFHDSSLYKLMIMVVLQFTYLTLTFTIIRKKEILVQEKREIHQIYDSWSTERWRKNKTYYT